jgi:hypothetical protein
MSTPSVAPRRLPKDELAAASVNPAPHAPCDRHVACNEHDALTMLFGVADLLETLGAADETHRVSGTALETLSRLQRHLLHVLADGSRQAVA